MRRTITIVSLLLLLGSSAWAQRRAEYSNPVMAGDYPDPSVIRVGRDYWATATSSEWGPQFPLLHSRDLINWRQVGVVFSRRPAWAISNFWAPEIAEDRGRYYIYYTARRRGGPLCVAVATAAAPQGPYTDRGPLVCQEVGSIDGFPIRDENGRRYLLWKEDGNSVSRPTPIWAQPLSADGTRLVGERRELIRNDQPWEKHPTLPYGNLVEGPAIVRRGGWFYMFYSGNFCCARECDYKVGVARSRRLLGPWEKYSGNPIMEGNDEWKCPGHGTLVDDPSGRLFFLYHAMHARDTVYVGRQGLLDEVKWNADGWPTINDGRGPSGRAASPLGVRDDAEELSFADEFRSRALAQGWQFPQGFDPTWNIRPAGGGWLSLTPAAGRTEDVAGGVLARSTTTGDYVATTLVETGRARRGLAGLSAFGDVENALGISAGNGRVVVWRREKKEHREVAEAAAPVAPRIYLRMTARDGHRYRFAYSADGRAWTDVGGEQDGAYLPPWDRGVRVALVAGGAPRATGRFDWLRIVPTRR
jgi:beta-xylosidase